MLRFPHLLILLAHLPLLAGAEPLVRVANTTLGLPVEAPAETYTKEVAFSSLSSFNVATSIVSPPGETTRLFIVQKGGKITVLTNLPGTDKETFLDIESKVDPQGESGLLGLAFHPNYAANGYFYIFYSFSDEGKLFQRVSRMSVSSSDSNAADPSSEVPMITQEDDQDNHNGGDLHFGADGYLYVSLGDEGGADDQYDNGRFIDKDFFSGIMRIDVDQKPGSLAPNPHPAVHPGTYAIPPDNPYIGLTSYMGFATDPTKVRTEFWAAGFRNPWRFCIDLPTGRLICADVGQEDREEVNLVMGGQHYGWSYREGSLDFDDGPGGATPPAGFAPAEPIFDYGRSVGQSITGGRVYRGTRLGSLYEAYIFGDYGSSRVWAMHFKSDGSVDRVDHVVDVPNVSSFGIDPTNGDILAGSHWGHIYRIVKAAPSSETSLPETLSATGAFSDLATLTPNPGIVPYDTNVSFWSDGAVKQRWFSIPELADQIAFSENGSWSFPAGQVWIKHFELDLTPEDALDPHRRLETRFLVKTSNGIYGVTYRWNDAQTDATLVAEEGFDETFTIQTSGSPTSQTWRYPSRGECLSCHRSAAGYALGFDTRQLNRETSYGGGPCHQLAALKGAGYFSNPPEHVLGLPALADLQDGVQSLEHRARSYIAVNCSPCHRENGSALGNWDGRAHLTTEETQLINGLLVNNFGNASMRVVVPDSTSGSMIWTRMGSGGASRMPPIGSNVIDVEGRQLIADWITNELPSWQTYEEWKTEHFLDPSAPEAALDADPDGDERTNEMEFLTRTLPQDSKSAWDITSQVVGGNHHLGYQTVFGRATLVEVSVDAVTWTPWQHPSNLLFYASGSAATARAIPIPISGLDRQFVRLRFMAR